LSASAGRKHHTQPKPTTRHRAAELPPSPSQCLRIACSCNSYADSSKLRKMRPVYAQPGKASSL
jgi:hypothetical protein